MKNVCAKERKITAVVGILIKRGDLGRKREYDIQRKMLVSVSEGYRK